ncbi:hypothetical protein SCHPADRAFT_1000395, partial [Schizopora paradoxa]
MDTRRSCRARRVASGVLLLVGGLAVRAEPNPYPGPQRIPSNPITSLQFFTPTPSLPLSMSSPSASASPSPAVFLFENVPDMTVCGMGQISWLYSGDPSYTIGFAIANDTTDSMGNANSTGAWPLTILDGSTTPLSSQNSYDWSPVTFDAGNYTIVAVIPETTQLFTSLQFAIVQGDDNSCLVATTSGSSNTVSTSTSLSTTTATNVGVVAGSNSSKMGGGEVAGIVIGALAAAGLLIAAILLFRRCRGGRGGVGRFGKHERRPSRLFEKKGWLQSGNNGTFGGNISGGAVGLTKSPTNKGFGDLKDVDERGLHLDDSAYGKGLGLGFGINDYPHRLSYADQARNHAQNVGASTSEEDVSSSMPAQLHSQDFAREYSMFTPANRSVTVPLAIHRPGQVHHGHRGSVAESVLSDSTVVGSPQSAKHGAFPFTRPRRGTHQSNEFPPSSVPATPSAEAAAIEGSQDPFVSPPSTPSPVPSEVEVRTDSVSHGSALSHPRAHLINATVSGGDGTQLPVSLFHPSSQYIAPSPRSTFPQSVSASDLSVAPSMSSEFDAHSYGRPSSDLTAAYGLGLGFNPTVQAPALNSRRTMSSRKPVPYSSSEALELSPRSSPTGERHRDSHLGIGRSSTDSGSAQDWSSAAALSHSSSMPGGAGAVGRMSTSSRSTVVSEAPPSPYSPTTTVTNNNAPAGPFLGMKGLPELNHKSSFGDKPMHFIMPDPPAAPM